MHKICNMTWLCVVYYMKDRDFRNLFEYFVQNDKWMVI